MTEIKYGFKYFLHEYTLDSRHFEENMQILDFLSISRSLARIHNLTLLKYYVGPI